MASIPADVIAAIDGARPDEVLKDAMRWHPALAAVRGKSVTEIREDRERG